MSSYTISKKLNPKKVFILQKSELEKRFDPIFYAHEFNEYENSLNKKPHKKFSQILQSINNGFDFRDYKDSGTPYLKVANIKKGEFDFSKIQYINFDSSEISKNIQLKKGNILLTRKGTFGNAIALEQDYDYVISSEVFYLELKDNSINPKFLEIFFNSKIGQAQFDKNKIGAIMGSLSQEAIRDLKIPFPATDVQNEIVNIFNIYNEKKLNNLEKSKNLLNSIDTYLLKELGITLPEKEENTLKSRMFTASISELSGSRFDPYYHINYFNKVFQSIEKGKYEYSKMNQYVSFKAGYAFKSNDYVEKSECSLITIKNIKKNEIDLNDVTFLPSDFYELYKDFQINNEDLLIAMTGATIGKVGIYNHHNKALLNQRNGIIKPNSLNPIYLLSLLNLKIYQEIILRSSNGGAQPNISETDIMKISIPIPPIEKQLEIAEHISAIRKQAQDLKDQTKLLLEKANKEIEDILLNT
jgi:restriction endonuclease S subunit